MKFNRPFTLILIFLLMAFLIRGMTLIPFIIDDDEAWFSVMGYSMSSVRDALTAVIDNKPPGTAWYYWLIAQVFGSYHLTQWARLVQIALLAWAGYLFGRIASPHRNLDWAAVLLFTLIFGAAGPKLFAVTNEGLMTPWLILALYLVWPDPPSTRSPLFKAFCSGASLAIAVMIKQTGIIFFVPWIIAVQDKKNLAIGLFGFTVTVLANAFLVGIEPIWQWAFVYPFSVLTAARKKLFSSGLEVLPNLIIFVSSLLPILYACAHSLILLLKRKKDPSERVLIAWLFASLFCVYLGRALFLHYFLLLIPPIGLIVLKVQRHKLENKTVWIWIGAAYTVSAIIASVPSAGVFWGNDLPYFHRLGSRIQSLTPYDSKIFVWGGNVLPQAITGHPTFRSFPNARFVSAPYATPSSFQNFLRQFKSDPPDLVLDLHKRGDNRFKAPINATPEFQNLIRQTYEPWIDPSLPWVIFYLKKESAHPIFLQMIGLCRAATTSSQFLTSPKSLALIKGLIHQAFSSPHEFFKSVSSIHQWDTYLRAYFANEWLETACLSPGKKPKNLPSFSVEEAQAFSEFTQEVFKRSGYSPPFSLESPIWWVSLALVELQPD